MRKFSLVVFPDEVAAFRGFHALHLFHRARSVSLHGAAVFERGENGAASVRKRSPVVPLGGGLGAFVSGRSDLLEFVVRQLAPGTIAMIAETSDEWGAPIDARMEMLGGKMVCEWWRNVGDDALEQRTRRNAEHAARRTEPRVSMWGRLAARLTW
jgi:hypothetical protein